MFTSRRGVLPVWELSQSGRLRKTDSLCFSESAAGCFTQSGEHEWGFYGVMPLGLSLKTCPL